MNQCNQLTNPCNEIPLGTWEQCIAMVEDIRVDRFTVDEFMNAFVRVLGKKKKKKVIWRSIDSQWMPTKRD